MRRLLDLRSKLTELRVDPSLLSSRIAGRRCHDKEEGAYAENPGKNRSA